MKIAFHSFLNRQFEKGASGTRLQNKDRAEYMRLFNEAAQDPANVYPSDNDFCKYVIVENPFDDIKSPVMPLTLDLYPFIRTSYSARVATELPVLTRFVQLPPGFDLPKANYLVGIVYTTEQLKKEHEANEDNYGDEFSDHMDPSADYGLICVLGTVNAEADPYVPVTIMRNALGMTEGGNGVPLDRDMYMKSVDFWSKNIMVGGQ